MSDVIRLKRYQTFLDDGHSSTTWGAPKGRVFVAVIVGTEPAKMADYATDECPIDDVILAMAKHITNSRRRQNRKANA